MPVKKEPSGRRSVQAEVEVPGTPEEVWRAIATGPGISSWFVPTKLEEREGGTIEASFGPNMDSLSNITQWDPPRRYVADSRDDMPANGPTIATEWTVEARDGGRCVVRVVHSWFAETDDWDDQFGQHEYGWHGFFRLLRLYLTHFAGQDGTVVQLMGASPEPKDRAWAKLMGALAIEKPEPGARVQTAAPAPELDATVEHVGAAAHPEDLVVRLAQPAPGFAHFFAMPMAGQTFLPMRLFLFGPNQTALAARESERWQKFLAATFSA